MTLKRTKTIPQESGPSEFDKAVFAWSTKDYDEFDRGLYWKIFMSALLIILVAGGLYYGSWTFSLAIVVFAIVYYIVHKNPPVDLSVVIADVGIKIGNKQFAYQKISGFYIAYNPPLVKKVVFILKGELIGELKLDLEDQNPVAINDFLKTKITEIEKKSESFTDLLKVIFKI